MCVQVHEENVYTRWVIYTYIREAELHLLDVTMERSVYREALEKVKSSIVSHFTEGGVFSPHIQQHSHPFPLQF